MHLTVRHREFTARVEEHGADVLTPLLLGELLDLRVTRDEGHFAMLRDAAQLRENAALGVGIDGAQQQRRVPADEQFRRDEDVGTLTGRPRSGLVDRPQIGRLIPDGRVPLHHRNSHGVSLSVRPSASPAR